MRISSIETEVKYIPPTTFCFNCIPAFSGLQPAFGTPKQSSYDIFDTEGIKKLTSILPCIITTDIVRTDDKNITVSFWYYLTFATCPTYFY